MSRERSFARENRKMLPVPKMAGKRAPSNGKKKPICSRREEIMRELPDKLVTSLMPFQKEGIEFAVIKNARCLIADEMGLGKTLQAIAVAAYYKAVWPLLIIVPSSLRYVWIEELEKWLPEILPNEINLIQSGFDTAGIQTAKVTLVTYGLLSSKSSAAVKEALLARNFNFVICDESHYFKNSRTECCKAVSPLLTAARHCILLSGTPALAKPSELYTQLDALQPGKFGSWWSFTKRFCDGRWEYFGRRRQWRADGASNLDELQMRLQSLMIRREKDSVLTQLPPKQRQKILFQLKDSQTKKEILTQFEELKPLLKKSNTPIAAALMGRVKENRASASSNSTGEQQEISILSRIQRLYKLAAEAKIGPAREYVQMLCENASLKFLVFAYHHCVMDGIQQTLWDKKVKFVRIDGSTKPSDRQLYVQQFQTDKDTRVAILSILAAGTGLTFTAAKLVVFAELYWTPGVMVQCEDRAHRIGQSSALPVHYLVARDTMDEWVWAAVCRKTLVTSTALTGRTRAMKADAGSSYQVDLLSAADEYKPADSSDLDISAFLQSQLPSDQKSILDFFSSPSQREPSKHHDFNKHKSTPKQVGTKTNGGHSVSNTTPLSSKRVTEKTSSTGMSSGCQEAAVVIESSEEEDLCELQLPDIRRKTAASSQSKKRRLAREGGLKEGSDSEFEDSKSRTTRSVKRRKYTQHTTRAASKSQTLTPSCIETHLQEPFSSTNTPSAAKQRASLQSPANPASKSDRGLKVNEISAKWMCSVCTFANHSLLPFCEMCETPRKKKENKEADTVDRPTPRTVRNGHADDSEDDVEECSEFSSSGSAGHCDGCDGPAVGSRASSAHTANKQQSLPQPKPLGAGNLRNSTKRTLTFGEKVSSAVSHSSACDKESGHSPPVTSRSSSLFTGKSNNRTLSDGTNFDDVSLTSELSGHVTPSQFSCVSDRDLDMSESPPLFASPTELVDSDEDSVSVLSSPESCPSTAHKRPVDENESRESGDSHDVSQTSNQSFAKTESHTDSQFDQDSDSDLIKACDDASQGIDEKEMSTLPLLQPLKRRRPLVERETLEVETDPLISSSTDSKNPGRTSDSGARRRQRDGSQSPCGGNSGEEGTSQALQKTLDVSKTVQSLSDSEREGSTVGGQRELVPGVTWSGKVHDFFLFCCSTYTGRVYIFDEHSESLGANFQPLDVELENIDNLPQLLHHPNHLRIVQTFVRQWNSLTDTKRRLISKRGLVFRSPLSAYDSVRTDMSNNKQRYMTKEDQAKSALKKASGMNGHVRVITKHCSTKTVSTKMPGSYKRQASTDIDASTSSGQHRGFVQVVSEDGTPLCLQCQTPCSSLLSRDTVTHADNAWNTRFCSRACADEHWMKTNTAYLRGSIYDIQHGICQLCQFDAHSFFCQVRDTLDLKERARIVSTGKYEGLGLQLKKQMISKPNEGLFWHVDHIKPVWEGGGQCDIDNLRTLCTPCHSSVTSRQATKRAQARRLSKAAFNGDITAFFKKS